MGMLITDCPRCDSAQITFDVTEANLIGISSDWVHRFEVFSICRKCRRSTVFVIEQTEYPETAFIRKEGPLKFPDALNNHFKVRGFISLTDRARASAPEFTDEKVAGAFNEAAACMTVQAWNGAAALLRLSIDLATKPLLPDEFTAGLNRRTRRDLAPRLTWLLDNGKLPSELRGLSDCIREDGNDGAHDGTLGKEDAEDLIDFAVAMFERMYTEPQRLKLAQERRDNRRRGERN